MVQRRGCRKGTYGLHTNKRVIRNYKYRFYSQNWAHMDCIYKQIWRSNQNIDQDWSNINQEIWNDGKQEYIFNQQTKQTQQEYDMQRLERSLKKISQKLQMFPNVYFQNNQANIDDIVPLKDKKQENYNQALKNQIEIKIQKKKLLRIHNQYDWEEFDMEVEKFRNNTDQNLYEKEAEAQNQKNKFRKSTFIQQLNKLFKQYESNRNMKYLKGVEYDINQTEKRKIFYNNSNIVSHRHRFKSDEEKQRKQKIIQHIIKEHKQYKRDIEQYQDSIPKQLLYIEFFDINKEYLKLPKRPIERQNGCYKHLFLDNEWTKRNENHVPDQKFQVLVKDKEGYSWHLNYGRRIHPKNFMFDFDKNVLLSNQITGVAPPSFRKGVDGWNQMKNKIGGQIIFKFREHSNYYGKMGVCPDANCELEWHTIIKRNFFIKRRRQLKTDTQQKFKECFDFK